MDKTRRPRGMPRDSQKSKVLPQQQQQVWSSPSETIKRKNNGSHDDDNDLVRRHWRRFLNSIFRISIGVLALSLLFVLSISLGMIGDDELLRLDLIEPDHVQVVEERRSFRDHFRLITIIFAIGAFVTGIIAIVTALLCFRERQVAPEETAQVAAK